MKRRIISLLMAVVLVFTLLPVGALAEAANPGEESSVDIEAIIAAVEEIINGKDTSTDLGSILEGLDYNQLAQVIAGLLEDKVDIGPILDMIDINQLVDTVKALIDGDADIGSILNELDTEQLVELISGLIGDNETLGEILKNLDTEQLVAVIKGLVDGEQDIGSVIDQLDFNQLVGLITGLFDDNEALDAVLDQLDVNEIVAVIKALIAGDEDISSIIANLDSEQLAALVTAIIGDNETLKPILDKLDMAQLIKLVKDLIAGDVDISNIISNLDPYKVLKLISGLFGNELDVVGPNNVTVTETEDAVFSVKVRLSLMDQLNDITYKYMWLEPEDLGILNDVNFENLDVASLILRIAGKSLGNGETFTVQNTTMRDDGRKFTCVIYNISEKVFYVTDEATLTVTPFSECPHDKLMNIRAVEPNCVDDGNCAYYECSVCHKLFLDKECKVQTNAKDVVIPALGHTPIENPDKPAVAPTCTETGLTVEITCSACGDVLEARKPIPALGHTPIESKPAVAPSCTETGLTAELVCRVCGETVQAQEVVPATGHTKVIDVAAKDPTCTETGCIEGSHCGVCGEVLSSTRVIPALGHSFGNGITCTVCGEYMPFPFTDVPEGFWCRSEVEYVWKHGLMNGVTPTLFAPDRYMTRAMFVTVLYRMEGCPSVDGLTEPFTDVDKNHWAYTAILWAYNSGVTNGVTATTFAPELNINRAQLVTMLYRYEGAEPVSGILTFNDSNKIAVPYRAAVLWATRNGIVYGTADGNFDPEGTAKRSHMAAILARYCEMK